MIVGKVVEAAAAREAARKARELTRTQGQRHHLAAGQARRLPGARSRQGRAADRRGRLGRRLGQDGARPRVPGGAAAARQDPQRRARALRQDAVVRADRHADHGARHRHRLGGVQRRQAALPQDHHHDRRRRRRLAHPHAAADVLLPPDARADRPRLHLHRAGAALQGRARQVRAVPQGRARAGGLPDRHRARGHGVPSAIRATSAPAPTSKAIVEEARAIRNVLSGLHSRYNRKVVEQAAIAGVLTPAIFGDAPKALAAAAIHRAGGSMRSSEEIERGWEGTFIEGEGFRFERTVRGVKEVAVIDHALLGSADARKLDEHAARAAGDLRAARRAAPQGRGYGDPRPGRACSRRSPPPAARASRCSATRASAR